MYLKNHAYYVYTVHFSLCMDYGNEKEPVIFRSFNLPCRSAACGHASAAAAFPWQVSRAMVNKDGMVPLMAEILHQLRLVVYPINYKVLYIQTVVGLGISSINGMTCGFSEEIHPPTPKTQRRTTSKLL